MRVGIITQARMTSTRLPGKVLLPLGDNTVLGIHLDRLRRSGLPVAVATTTNHTDDVLVGAAERHQSLVHRGSESDVLERFLGAATTFEFDVVVRVTSDCPLIDGDLIAESVRRWLDLDDPMAYLSNTVRRTYPRGFDFEVFSLTALQQADRNANSSSEREHVTPYFYSGIDRAVSCHFVERFDDGAADMRLTIDTAQDYAMVAELMARIPGAASMGVEEIIAGLRAHPDVVAMNADVVQKET